MDGKKFIKNLVRPRSRESTFLEWKATMRFCLKDQDTRKYVTETLCRSICASANNEGGRILVGYDEDTNSIVGIEKDDLNEEDGTLDEDKWKRSLLNKLSSFVSPVVTALVKIDFFSYEENVTCALIYVERSYDLIKCPDKNGNPRIYVRQDGNNDPLIGEDNIRDFQRQRNKKSKNSSPKGWSTRYIDSYIDDEIINLSWVKAGIVDKDIINQIPVEPGIYIFSAAQKDKNEGFFSTFKSPLYIGISEVNIRERFKRHLRKREFKECIKIYENKFEFYYAVVHDRSKQELEVMEHRLILKFGPSLNKINSPGRNNSEIKYV